jgi:large subunit ribosomal protein L15
MADTPKGTGERIGLHNLKPARGARKERKRVGRGEGSGVGKTSGRGHKGQGSRAGSKKRKLRGPHMKKSMPFEKFRTHTQPVNLRDLEARFDKGAEVTPDSLREHGLATRKDVPVKVLGDGELSKALTVHANAFSKTAREKIEGAGGTCQLIEG